MNRKKEIAYYMGLPWSYIIEPGKDEKGDKIFIVEVNELPGICTDAPTLDEAMAQIKEVMEATFELYLDMDKEIPEPIDEAEYQGNIAYRTSSRRHYLLSKEALRRKQSLSKLIDEYIDSSMKRNR